MRNISLFIVSVLLMSLCSCKGAGEDILVENDGDNAKVTVTGRSRYLMLPIQESSWEVRVRAEEAAADVPAMDIRLANDSIDYWLPFPLPEGRGPKVVNFSGLWEGAVAWKSLYCTDKPELPAEAYRPVYHHTPSYGWMNDPNGMFFKDGRYHLYYQYNPYGCTWGNMHWGHSSSEDLLHWESHPVALQRDTLGHIYSGSAVVDYDNVSGFGEGAVVAFYTAHSEAGESQCLAWSNDNGLTFTKYSGNPVVVSSDGIRDFRDPKVFRYGDKWVMVLAANYEVRFYSSANLRDWEYTGCFGKGYGAQPSLWECPDLVQLPVDDGHNGMKWMLIVNVNPGGVFGGSATEYFIGEFDGKTFICDTPAQQTKWLDYGKDHYAAVTFSGTPDRTIAMAWMSNWQYADKVPSAPFRSANALPRELKLFSCNGQVYASQTPVPELSSLISNSYTADGFSLQAGQDNKASLLDKGSCKLSFNVRLEDKSCLEICLVNLSGESVSLILDGTKLSLDRSHSGMMTDRDDFSQVVSAPLDLCSAFDGYDMDIYLDRSSIEVFVDGGKLSITELLFPAEPFNALEFIVRNGSAHIGDITVRELALGPQRIG